MRRKNIISITYLIIIVCKFSQCDLSLFLIYKWYKSLLFMNYNIQLKFIVKLLLNLLQVTLWRHIMKLRHLLMFVTYPLNTKEEKKYENWVFWIEYLNLGNSLKSVRVDFKPDRTYMYKWSRAKKFSADSYIVNMCFFINITCFNYEKK